MTLVFLILTGCRAEQAATTEPERSPVAECERYEAAVRACFHRDVAVATDQAYIPASDTDRDRMRTICSENLRRLGNRCPSALNSRTP
jgi:hypothetical protein